MIIDNLNAKFLAAVSHRIMNGMITIEDLNQAYYCRPTR
jgi:hypothetical protein